jgi:tripartite-type tricarboxylate transporter receptor subunit TctC
VPVVFVGSVPNVLVVGNGVPADSVQALVALAKKEPGKLNFATSGAGSTQHIAAEMFKDAAGIQITHVPYKGSGPALVDLIGGQVQMSFDTMPSVIGQIRNGKIRALAVTTAKRNAQLPNVPTMAEAGVPGRGDERLVRHLHAGGHAQGGAGQGVRGRDQGAWPCRKRRRGSRP